jgi:hypothetical protein
MTTPCSHFCLTEILLSEAWAEFHTHCRFAGERHAPRGSVRIHVADNVSHLPERRVPGSSGPGARRRGFRGMRKPSRNSPSPRAFTPKTIPIIPEIQRAAFGRLRENVTFRPEIPRRFRKSFREVTTPPFPSEVDSHNCRIPSAGSSRVAQIVPKLAPTSRIHSETDSHNSRNSLATRAR